MDLHDIFMAVFFIHGSIYHIQVFFVSTDQNHLEYKKTIMNTEVKNFALENNLL